MPNCIIVNGWSFGIYRTSFLSWTLTLESCYPLRIINMFRWTPQEEEWLRQHMMRGGSQDRKHWMSSLVNAFLRTFPPSRMKKGGIWETDREFFERKTRIPTVCANLRNLQNLFSFILRELCSSAEATLED